MLETLFLLTEIKVSPIHSFLPNFSIYLCLLMKKYFPCVSLQWSCA